jgi:hypothetical protein
MLRRLRLLALVLIAAATVFTAGAAAEMPQNRDAPTITAVAAPVVGQPLTGNNGTWLYDNGSACRDECNYAFAWQRCIPGGACAQIPGALQRTYVVGAADVGRTLRVAVTATKYDCNAHGVDCRNVSRTALSTQTPPIPAPAPPPVQLTIAELTVAPRGRAALLVALRITDGRGRSVAGARTIVRSAGSTHVQRSGPDGWARLVLRRPKLSSVPVAIRVDRPGDPRALPTSLVARVPLGR